MRSNASGDEELFVASKIIQGVALVVLGVLETVISFQRGSTRSICRDIAIDISTTDDPPSGQLEAGA